MGDLHVVVSFFPPGQSNPLAVPGLASRCGAELSTEVGQHPALCRALRTQRDSMPPAPVGEKMCQGIGSERLPSHSLLFVCVLPAPPRA